MTRADAIRARLAAATKGPWRSDGEIVGWWCGEQPAVAVRYANPGRPDVYTPVCMVGQDVSLGGRSGGSMRPVADADLIAHAPADLAYLLEQHARLRELLTEAYQRMTRQRGGADAMFLSEINEVLGEPHDDTKPEVKWIDGNWGVR